MTDDWEYRHNRDSAIVCSTEERNKRIEVCKSCELLTPQKLCSKCMCFMPLKTWLKFSKCPEGKW